VPERRSKIYTNKKFPGNLEFPEGNSPPPAAVCLEETLNGALLMMPLTSVAGVSVTVCLRAKPQEDILNIYSSKRLN